MRHFGLLGSSLVNLLYTAVAIGVAANLLWSSPWSQAEGSNEVVTQLEYKHLDQQNAAQLKGVNQNAKQPNLAPRDLSHQDLELQHLKPQDLKLQKAQQQHGLVASSTARLVSNTTTLATHSLHTIAATPHTIADRRTLSATSAPTQTADAPNATQKRAKAPRRSFSFHYLDILEWLFARKPDTNNVAQPRPTTGNLRH